MRNKTGELMQSQPYQSLIRVFLPRFVLERTRKRRTYGYVGGRGIARWMMRISGGGGGSLGWKGTALISTKDRGQGNRRM